MKNINKHIIAVILICISAHSSAFASKGDCTPKIRFEAPTTAGFRVSGSVVEISACSLDYDEANHIVKNLHIAITPGSLSTGMQVRDRHMLEDVFTVQEGLIPNIQIDGSNVVLQEEADNTYAGDFTMSFRGKSAPVRLNIALDSPTSAKGNAKIKLSDFDVAPIKLMGVSLKDEVDIYVDQITIQ